MQKYFAMFFLSAVFAFMAHAADDLTSATELKQQVGAALDSARTPASPATKADNSACPYAADNLTYAIPGTTAAKLWREDGHVRLPANVSGTDSGATAQKITAKGGGLLSEQDAKSDVTMNAELAYDNEGHLKQLKLTQQQLYGRGRSSTLDYSHDAAGCRLERVVLHTYALGSTAGVSFDAKLCQKLSNKHLLDPKTAKTCSDYNVQVGAAVSEFTATLAKDEAFTIFTSSPAGGTMLKPYSDRNPGAANAALAQDCNASWRPTKGIAANDQGGVERGDSAASPTTAR
jgi:hypothetical protein